LPKSPALRSSLWGLNRARLLTAAIVLAVGALLRFTEAFPYAFGTFAMAVLGGAAACLVLPLGERRGVPLERIAWFQFGLDAILITGIITATGGPQSVFIPLYVLLVVASCFVLSGRGGLFVAGICSLLYVLPVLGRTIVPMLKVGAPSENTALEILTVFMNAGVLLAVAVVTGALAERYHELQEHMEDQRKHLSDLQAFRDLIFESVGSGLVGVDPTGRVTAFNRAAESITGVRAEDAVDQGWETIFGDGVDLAEVSRAVSDGSEPAPRYEFRLRRRDGQEVPVGISFWSLRSGTGDVAGLIGVCQDLSSIKQMEQRMRQADRCPVGRLSANMAHEIRNPLASISGAVEALARDLPPDSTRSQLVEIVLRESARLNQIVGDFLEYARPAPMATTNMAEISTSVAPHRAPHATRQPEGVAGVRRVAADPGRSPATAAGGAEFAQRGPGDARRRRAWPTRSRSPTPARASRTPTCRIYSSRSSRRSRKAVESAWLSSIGSSRSMAARSRCGAAWAKARPSSSRFPLRKGLPADEPEQHPDAVGRVPAPRDEADMSEPRVLVVDDEKSMRDLLAITLQKAGYEVTLAEGGAAAMEAIRRDPFDAIITDLRMPKVDGLQVLRCAKDLSPDTAVIMVTAMASTETAVEAMKLGAYDYITKPFKLDEVNLIIKNALERKQLRAENQYLRKQLETQHRFENIIGKSGRMVEVFDTIRKIADSPSTVMITGESGTGKELVARAIHFNSHRRDKPFVSVNCGAIPEGLMESELFGHVKGAFTGAVANKIGLFTAAEGGTLFLDEITEIPALLQVKLLRAIQVREIRRVGDTRDVKTDVRLIAASNRDLETAVRDGVMREDLFYRLNVIPIHLPPLRERREDIPLLIAHFLQKFSKDLGKDVRGVAPDALSVLERYHWPGNIRELENVLERAVVLGAGDMLTAEALPESVRRERPSRGPELVDIPDEGLDLETTLDDLERRYLQRALDRTGGVQTKAAELLRMTFRQFRYKLQKHSLAKRGAPGDE
jgi:two-component system response regulator PilR (NtrC family)